MKFVNKLFNRHPYRAAAHNLYLAASDQSRAPELYELYAVPDTLAGRFDSLILHVFLILHRLRNQGEAVLELSHEVVQVLIADLDRTMREQGIADVGVGKRVKKMLQAFYGRIGAYDAGLAAEDAPLEEGLVRNVFRGAPPPPPVLAAFTSYVRAQQAHLDAQPNDAYMSGNASFAAEFPTRAEASMESAE